MRHGCDATRKAMMQGRVGPREAQVAHKARTRGKRPRGSMRMPVRGASWREEGWKLEGPRVSGPGKMIGAVMQ